MNIPCYLDVSGSIAAESFRLFGLEVRKTMAAIDRQRLAHRLWQKKHKPERVRNRIRRASRRINRH